MKAIYFLLLGGILFYVGIHIDENNSKILRGIIIGLSFLVLIISIFQII